MRYDIAVEDPRYIKELANTTSAATSRSRRNTEEGPLSKMMKPGMGSYYSFKELFDKVFQRSGQAAVPDPLLHLCPPGHHG